MPMALLFNYELLDIPIDLNEHVLRIDTEYHPNSVSRSPLALPDPA